MRSLRWICTAVICSAVIALWAYSAAASAKASSKADSTPDVAIQPNPLKPVAVAAFKNGFGFFIRQGNVPLVKGEGRLPIIPDAALGTMWLNPADSGTTLDELVAYHDKTVRVRRAGGISDLLAANIGRKVTITFNGQNYTGEIQDFSPRTELTPIRREGGPYSDTARIELPQPNYQTELLYLKLADKGTMVVNPQGISALTFDGSPSMDISVPDQPNALRFRLKGAGDSATMNLGYLQRGIGWTPSYLLSLTDDRTAHLTMQAVVVNDAEDLHNTDIYFVVGYPSFAYSDVLSPMTLQQSLNEFLRGVQTNSGISADSSFLSNSIAGQMISKVAEYDRRDAVSFRPSVSDMAGAPDEDLFLYTRKNVTLARGERASYNVFSADVSIDHIYELEIPDSQNSSYQSQPQPQPTHTVWHALRMTNSSSFPWTTAPAFVLSGNQPVAQNTLVYTPKPGTSNLKLTVATDIRATSQELETLRQPRSYHWNGYDYDAVTVEGTLKAKNYKNKAVTLVVHKSLTGEVLAVSSSGKAEKSGQGVQSVNPHSDIHWEVPVKAGDEVTLTYKYRVYTR